MYGVTRATTTLVGAAAAGLLIWIATQLNHGHEAGYWGIVGLIAGAGLIMALSQLLGGWTKWGMPRLSPSVFLFAFVPVAIVSLWVILAAEPHHGWFHRHADVHPAARVRHRPRVRLLVRHDGAAADRGGQGAPLNEAWRDAGAGRSRRGRRAGDGRAERHAGE